MFTLTLVYVGVRLVRRWRTKQQLTAAAAAASGESVSVLCDDVELGGDSLLVAEERGGGEGGGGGSVPVLPPCGHAQCARAALLPYTGLAATAWLPELLLQGPQQTHNTAVCRGRCQACRDLARPPPSYTKLFLEDQPPEYDDSLVIKTEAGPGEAAAAAGDDVVICVEAEDEVSEDVTNLAQEVESIKDSIEYVNEVKNEDEETPLTDRR